jgi:hypothetical protein
VLQLDVTCLFTACRAAACDELRTKHGLAMVDFALIAAG